VAVCDFLYSADLLVAAADQALERLEAVLDLSPPGPRAYARSEAEGWDVIFAQVNDDLAVAPTRLEIVAPLDRKGGKPSPARKVFEGQAPRAWRTHATVVATPDLPGLVERVRRAGARHWLQLKDDKIPFDRLRAGVPEGDLADYDPAADGGFRFTFIPSDCPAFPPEVFRRPHDKPQRGDPGMRRIRARTFLVNDIDESLRRLEAVFGWTPADPVREEPSRGYRFVSMSSNHPHGATLRLIQATNPDTRVGRDFAAQGPGPYVITIVTYDLDAMEAALADRGAPARRLEPGKWDSGAILPDGALGAPFLLVDDELVQ
jgi:hypothetical protein